MISGTTARSSSCAAPVRHAVDVQHVEQAAAGVADGGDDALQPALAVVFDDDAGVGREVGAEVGIDPLGIGDGRRHAVVDETPSQRAAFDQELDVEGAREHPVQGPDDQLVLTDGQRAHNPSIIQEAECTEGTASTERRRRSAGYELRTGQAEAVQIGSSRHARTSGVGRRGSGRLASSPAASAQQFRGRRRSRAPAGRRHRT